MSAQAATAVTSASVAATRPGKPPPARAGDAASERFDQRLDTARQQRRDDAPRAQAAAATTTAAKKPAAADGPADHAEPVKPETDTDGQTNALSVAMLALLGQAVPAVPVAIAAARTAAALLGATPAATDKAAPPAAALMALPAIAPDVASVSLHANTGAVLDALLPAAGTLHDDPTTASLDPATAAAMAAPTGVTAASNVPPAHALTLASPVGTPAFGEELGHQITWLGQQDLKQARIRLHPEDLGPLDIKMTVNHDKVDLTFIAQHPATVHAVQQSLAQLDAMLAQHGLALGHADVSQQQRGDGNAAQRSTGGAPTTADENAVAGVAPTVYLAPTLLDTFA